MGGSSGFFFLKKYIKITNERYTRMHTHTHRKLNLIIYSHVIMSVNVFPAGLFLEMTSNPMKQQPEPIMT